MVMDRVFPTVSSPIPPAGSGLVMVVGSAVAHSRHSPMRLRVGWGGSGLRTSVKGPGFYLEMLPASTLGDGADEGLARGTRFLGLEGESVTLAHSPLAPPGCRSLGNGESCLPRWKNKWYREQITLSHESLNAPN